MINLVDAKLRDPNEKYFGIHLVEYYELYDSLELLEICKFYSLKNETDAVLKLIGKKSHYNDIKKKRLL